MHPIVEAYYDKGGVIPYAVPGALPEKYAAMVPEGWGKPVDDNSVDELSAKVGDAEVKGD